MLNEAEIEQYMKNKGVMYGENASIVGVVMPNKISYFTGKAAPLVAAMCTQYYAINISGQGIAVIGIDNVTGRLRQEAFLYISRDEIQKVQFDKKLLSYQMEIKAQSGVLGFKVNKTMIGAPWHKINLEKIISQG